MPNELQTGLNPRRNVLLGDKNLHKEGCFLIRYRGCIVRQDEENGLERGRYMDFLVPGKEHGLISFTIPYFRGRFYNRIGLEECDENDLHHLENNFGLLIKIRNLLFFDAMIFARFKGNLYRLMVDDGPAYLSVSNDTFGVIWTQVLRKDQKHHG